MIDDILRQNWSTLHSLAMISSYGNPPEQSDAPKLVRGEESWKLGMEWCSFRARPSLHFRSGVVRVRDVFVNSFKHILNNSITSHGMKVKCFFPFHSCTRV